MTEKYSLHKELLKDFFVSLFHHALKNKGKYTRLHETSHNTECSYRLISALC